MSNNFWTNSAIEPKRAYKFLLSIPGTGGGTGVQEFLVKNVGKPSFTIGSTPHAFLNHEFYYPGKTKWDPITVTVMDAVNGGMNTSQAVMRMLEESGYELPTNPNTAEGRQVISKNKAVNVGLGQVKIKTLNSDGEIIEEWVLRNAFITKAEFGTYDYANEDLQQVTISLQYDNAYLNVKRGDSVGPIPNTPGAT
jgi:hypothetical protein